MSLSDALVLTAQWRDAWTPRSDRMYLVTKDTNGNVVAWGEYMTVGGFPFGPPLRYWRTSELK